MSILLGTKEAVSLTRNGPQLAALRDVYGATQDELANELGVSRPTISNRETRAEVDDDLYAEHKAACIVIHERKKKELKES